MSRIRRVLHPSDFSRASGAAFTKAVDLPKTNKAELLLVHVLAPTLPMLGDGYVSPKVYEDLVASARALFLGSIAGSAVAIAPCPVMTVRGK